jgi:hypothetical protein
LKFRELEPDGANEELILKIYPFCPNWGESVTVLVAKAGRSRILGDTQPGGCFTPS